MKGKNTTTPRSDQSHKPCDSTIRKGPINDRYGAEGAMAGVGRSSPFASNANRPVAVHRFSAKPTFVGAGEDVQLRSSLARDLSHATDLRLCALRPRARCKYIAFVADAPTVRAILTPASVSQYSGRPEVYLTSFPGAGSKRQVLIPCYLGFVLVLG